jgi:PAS domain S-box-containing protein
MDSKRHQILMIEDDQAEAELIKEMLADIRKQRFSVQQVHYLSQGLELLKQGSFDCVLVDLGLPDSHGLESALSVRRQDPDVPIVVLTVLDDEDSALNALELDIQDYLIKGEINSAVLARSIRYAMHRKGLAKQLSQSEEKLRYALQAAELGTWNWNMVTDELVLSGKSRELFGCPPDSRPTYADISAAIHPEDRERVDAAFHRALKEHGEYSEEMRVMLPDGALRWVLSKGRCSYDPEGKPLQVAGINLDITRRKEAEALLRISERKFSQIFRSAPTIILVTTLGEGRIVDANPVAVETLGYSRDELIGRTVFELDLWEDPSTRVSITGELAGGKPIRNLEMSYRCKEGKQVIGLLSAERIVIEDEECALVMVRDITERKRHEQALLWAKAEWERTFNSIPDLIAILDNDNRIVRVNQAMAERLGKPAEECVGMLCYAAFHGTDRPPGTCAHLKAVAEARQQIVELEELGSGGFFLVSYTPLLSPEGKPAGLVHVARDITDRKLAEKRIEQLAADLAARATELEEANRELEAFNYTAAHDLRQPLNLIYGYCQAIEMMCGNQLDEECRTYLHDTYKGILRMSRLIDALLSFSRMSRVELHRETVDLSGLARSVAKELHDTAPGRAVTFRIAEGIEVNADPELLRIVLDNLFGNAWKYTAHQADPIIELGRIDLDGEPAYFVRDNGRGFEMTDAAKLFAPFQRLAGAEGERGFGIGLATVQRIILRHGGRIWAEGKPGAGATFYFTLG